MPEVQGSMPLKHDPTVDLITAKPNKQKSISAGKVKEDEEKKRKLDQNDQGDFFSCGVQQRGGIFAMFAHRPNKSERQQVVIFKT